MAAPNPKVFIALSVVLLISIISALGIFALLYGRKGVVINEDAEIWPITVKKRGDGYVTELQFSINSSNVITYTMPYYLAIDGLNKSKHLIYNDLISIHDKQFRLPFDTWGYKMFPQNIDIPVTIDRLKRNKPIWTVSLLTNFV